MKNDLLKINIETPIYSIGEGSRLLIVLHGYGQLAQFFIQKFKPLLKHNYTVIAPEGLHRFYLKGNNGRVGASWMTKEKRELDIENYIQYLNTFFTRTKQERKWKSINVLGFSQGVATAFRWVADGLVLPNKLLICSGMIPPDVNLNLNQKIFSTIEITYFTGNQDPYRTEDAVVSFQKLLKTIPFNIKLVEFDGVHEVNIDEVVKTLLG